MGIDFSKPLQTADGRPARLLCNDLKDERYSLVVAVEESEKLGETAFTYTSDGRRRLGYPEDENWALQNVPETMTVYLNIYRYSDQMNCGYAFLTKEAAILAAQDHPISVPVLLAKPYTFDLPAAHPDEAQHASDERSERTLAPLSIDPRMRLGRRSA
ncbi:MAG: hypothetical protein H6905_06245 [Hyphomicrobiales bacterium]|nr:hypothetical protein [Hyphomicrobiales bacterium]